MGRKNRSRNRNSGQRARQPRDQQQHNASHPRIAPHVQQQPQRGEQPLSAKAQRRRERKARWGRANSEQVHAIATEVFGALYYCVGQAPHQNVA